MLALLAWHCHDLAWSKKYRHTGRVKFENVWHCWHASVMAWHRVKHRHPGRVKFENVGIVGMPVLWLGME